MLACRSGLLLLAGLSFVLETSRAQVGVLQTKVTTLGCGSDFGCMREPLGCQSPDCTAVAKWKASDTAGYVDIELMTRTASGWVALGLSSDQLMGDDSVSHCIANSSNNNEVIVGLSYNWVNTSRYSFVLQDSEITRPLLNASASYVDGEVHCRFMRPVQADGQKIFALDKPYYLLMAYGPARAGVKQIHSDTSKSQEQVVMTTDRGIHGQGEPGSAGAPQGSGEAGRLYDPNGNEVLFKASSDGKYVQFTLRRNLSSANANEWVALGFSNDDRMQDDSIIECVRLPSGQVVARNSWNGFHENIPSNPSDVGIVNPQTKLENGMIECNLLRPVGGVEGNSQVYPLTQSYIPLLAYGPVNNNGQKEKHIAARALSRVDFLDNSTVNQGAGGQNGGKGCVVCLKRAHGILMITAWVLIVSTSIIIARYYKTCWHEKKLCTTDVWFSLHRFLMLLGLAITIAAFIIIFYVNDGKISDYAAGSPSYFWVHAPLGICVMILVILNPLMAAFRCHPGTKYRPIFNWLHWCVGTCAHVIALITIFFGIKIGEKGPTKICHIAVFWIMIAFVGFHVAVEILLSIDKCISESRSKRSFQVQYEMSKPGEVPRVIEPTVGSCSVIFRYIILAFYFLVVLGLWLGMVILIGSGKI